MLKIGIDAMGGDRAPDVVIEGALLALAEVGSECEFVLFGDSVRIEESLSARGKHKRTFDVVRTSEVIDMQDRAAKAYREKTDSSIRVGYHYLKEGKIDGFASAGSSGAMLIGAVCSAGTIRNILRPAISALVCTADSGRVLLLDVGLNVDCKAEVLDQFGVIGSVYAETVLGMGKPRISLLNIGEEKEKGNLATKAAWKLMAANGRINFVGNMEADEIFTGRKADVVVCDGFVGNTILKQTEGFYNIARERGIHDDFIDKLDYEFVGGTAVLGINSVVLIGHGRSSALAIRNMILQTVAAVKAGLVYKLQDIFHNYS